MEISHHGFRSYYVHVRYHEKTGFSFDPHYLEVPIDITATITWFTDDPNLKFTGFVWCNENEHCSHHPLIRGNYMVGAAQTVVAAGDVYWKYQVKATVHGRPVESRPCTMETNGLPAIHPK